MIFLHIMYQLCKDLFVKGKFLKKEYWVKGKNLTRSLKDKFVNVPMVSEGEIISIGCSWIIADTSENKLFYYEF